MILTWLFLGWAKRYISHNPDPDFTVRQMKEVYLKRWWIIPRNKLFNIYLHEFIRSDDDRAKHDHPWHNASWVLSPKGYLEHLEDGRVVHRRGGAKVFRRAAAPHRVELIDNLPVLSLFFTGPVTRVWGFHCPNGWVRWTDFVAIVPGGNDTGRGCGE
jgi:hypothetical protein